VELVVLDIPACVTAYVALAVAVTDGVLATTDWCISAVVAEDAASVATVYEETRLLSL